MSVLTKRAHAGAQLRVFRTRGVRKKIKSYFKVLAKGFLYLFEGLEFVLQTMFGSKMVRHIAPDKFEEVERSRLPQSGQGFWG